MKVAIIGAGAAGSMAAIAAAESGAEVVVFDHNEKIGKKIYITGKGRCNFTNIGEDFFGNVVSNPKFLYAALRAFSPQDTVNFFEESGMPTKIERGNRAFPFSDKSSDVIGALSRRMRDLGVQISLHKHVTGLWIENKNIQGVSIDDEKRAFDRVIVATGGLSYPSTGSTGDGYRFAKLVGHNIIPLRASLVAIKLQKAASFTGLSLKNVRLSVYRGEKLLDSEFGELLFTEDGLSGPIVLTLSARLSAENLSNCTVSIDLKPALSVQQLDDRIQRDFIKFSNRDFINALDDLLPKSLIPEVIKRSGISENKKVHQITATERATLLAIVKNLCYSIKGTDSVEHAVVTAGGVDIREINPSTMESKLIRGLYFAGEILDLDAVTGGYNLQIAFSTGRLAGQKCAL